MRPNGLQPQPTDEFERRQAFDSTFLSFASRSLVISLAAVEVVRRLFPLRVVEFVEDCLPARILHRAIVRLAVELGAQVDVATSTTTTSQTSATKLSCPPFRGQR